MAKIWKATVELYFDLEDEARVYDAISEMLRPFLQAYGGDCLLDWCHAPVPSPILATPDEISGLEFQPGLTA